MISVKRLQQAARQAVRITDRYSSLPVLQYCVIGSNGDGLTLWTTSLDCYYSALLDKDAGPLPSQIIDPRNLVEIIRPMKGEIDLTVNDKGLQIAGATLASVVDPSEYPLLLKLSDVHHLATIDGKTFRDSIKRLCNHTLPDSETTCRTLVGVCFQSSKDKLTLTATNGHSLESDTFETTTGCEVERTINAKILKKIASAVSAKDHVRISTGSFNKMEFVRFQFAQNTYSVKPILDEFPDFQRVFDSSLAGETVADCTLNPKELLAVLKQSLPATPEKSSHAVLLALDGYELSIIADNETASFKHTIGVSVGRGEFKDYYDVNLLIKLVQDIKRDCVTFCFQERHKALRIEADDIQCLLMPVRLGE